MMQATLSQPQPTATRLLKRNATGRTFIYEETRFVITRFYPVSGSIFAMPHDGEHAGFGSKPERQFSLRQIQEGLEG